MCMMWHVCVCSLETHPNMFAAARDNGDNLAEVQRLMAAGADVDAVDVEDGETALLAAVGNGHIEIAKFLLDNGAAVDKASNNGLTPLQWAAWWGHTAMAELLLEAGGDPTKIGEEGRTPVEEARQEQNNDTAIAIEAWVGRVVRCGAVITMLSQPRCEPVSPPHPSA